MESKTGEKKLPGSSSSLGPGFRFHPTDEELVQYYLRRKVCGKAFRFDAISDVDVYKTEPWDLPHMSKLKTRDLEWYFFSLLDKKYGNGARTNRATEKGYWKTTGKDRAVYHKNQIVGMKKTLVYHIGRAPKGQRTNWVMHEYRLSGSALEIAGDAQDAFVVCRIFQKSGSGPKNGEQYGAPLVEEEWDNDELDLDHQFDATEEVDFGIDAGLNSHDIQQILGSDFQSNAAPLVPTSQCAGDQHCELQLSDNENIYNMPTSYDMNDIPIEQVNIGKCSKSGTSDDLNFLLDEPFLDSFDKLRNGDEGFIEANDLSNPAVSDDKNIYDMNAMPIEQVNIGKCRESGNSDDNFLLNEPFLDSFDKLPHCDEGFIEANNLSNPTVSDTTAFDMLDEYLTYFDANDDSSLYFTCDPDMMFGSDDLVCGQTLLPQKEMGEAVEVATLSGGQLIDNNTSAVVYSSDKPDSVKYQSEMQNPFVKQASQMLGNIPAPPAFAAEFPSKDTIVRLNSAICPSGTVRSYGKDENFNIVVSFGFSRGDDGFSSLESSVRIVPGKTTAATVTRGWLYFMFFWVLILYMSFRIGTYICAN